MALQSEQQEITGDTDKKRFAGVLAMETRWGVFKRAERGQVERVSRGLSGRQFCFQMGQRLDSH